MGENNALISKLNKFSDVMLALGVVMIVMMMIIPLPPFLLDLLLALNITLSLTIVMISIYNVEPLQFSVFPSLLLVTTLFRLALNVSATRLILLQGYAGEVILAFGSFVVGGNAVVGFIVFIILILIQFIVITKGAERVAEVAARFTLDAMPGKQMAIDADLNAGLINDNEARTRRRNIQREADFYGAMDGASKFVKGDAIAAIVIIVVNILGGFIIGMVQRDMSILQALQTYTLLTVGEGLVNQIPALLVTTATGLVVTRAASENNLGHDIAAQLLAYPRVFFLVAAVLAVLSAVPGLPGVPFLSIAILISGLGYILQKTAKTAQETAVTQQEEKELEEVRKPENIVSLLQVDPIELEIGYSLIPLVDVAQGGNLLDRVVMIRRQCALEMGIVVPTIRIRDNIQLKPNAYVIKIKGIEVAKGELLLDHFLAMNPGTVTEEIPGEETMEPAFGLPALWIHEAYRERAELSGYTVVDPISVLATHLTEVVKGHCDELLGRQDVQTLIDSVKQDHPAVVSELVPAMLSVGDIQKVLVCLLKERVSVRDLVSIMETLADTATFTKDPEVLAEYVRRTLSRNISRQYIQNNTLTCITLDPQTENQIVSGVQHSDRGSFVNLDPGSMQQFINSLSSEIQKLTATGFHPVLLTSPASRLYVRKLTERIAPNLVILSFAELENQIEVQSVGMVKI